MKWKRMGLTAALALATVGAPLASARDRCDRDYGRYQSSYSRYSRYDSRSYGYRSSDSNRYPEYRGRRSTGESAAIIGGSAAAGAAVGAIAGGGKGAAIGAVAGGIGGVVIDQATRPRNNYRNNYGRRW